ncbi:MAG: hypothetical protein HKN91_12330 [Acidimicrobiia bacterium]|nr:hypothetical protein [Acidimicrobiia bacterium]
MSNPMKAAFARLEAHRKELEMQIVFDLQRKFLSSDENVIRMVSSHDGSYIKASFDTEETDSNNDSHITISWIQG